ncbi:MAG: membrane protein insertion efficiency factor YidD [bacterium]|jgi:putative membrane protein insertion efficiency factor
MKMVLLGIISVYRRFISPLFGPHCRYVPTCSEYAYQAVSRYGCWVGGYLAARRICSCHPWGASGYDPVP